jgi:hypothetical protein
VEVSKGGEVSRESKTVMRGLKLAEVAMAVDGSDTSTLHSIQQTLDIILATQVKHAHFLEQRAQLADQRHAEVLGLLGRPPEFVEGSSRDSMRK